MHQCTYIITYAPNMTFLFLMEIDRDKVWYLMKKVVPLQRIPNVTYISNQTSKNLLVKRKKISS